MTLYVSPDFSINDVIFFGMFLLLLLVLITYFAMDNALGGNIWKVSVSEISNS